MYKAKIKEVQELKDAVNGSVNIVIVFSDGENEIEKSYMLHENNIKTKEEFQKFIQAEVNVLEGASSTLEIIKPLIGRDDILTELK